ncbi:MAG: HAD family hydrolase [Treponema sp.]|nr:HAD family hydrolase [Treponema sp.]
MRQFWCKNPQVRQAPGGAWSRTDVPQQGLLSGYIQKAEAFIFDFDGTLYDGRRFARRLLFSRSPNRLSLGDIPLIGAERAVRKSLAGFDYGNAEAYYREFFALLERRTSRPASFLRQWYFRRYMPRMKRVLQQFYPARRGASELFKNLACPRAVYSDYPEVRERLEAIGLDPGLCGMLCGPDTFGAQKPAPRPFLAIAAALRSDPSRVLVVGDRDDTDGEGASSSGMMFLRIAGHKNPADSGRPSLEWDQFVLSLLRRGGGYG